MLRQLTFLPQTPDRLSNELLSTWADVILFFYICRPISGSDAFSKHSARRWKHKGNRGKEEVCDEKSDEMRATLRPWKCVRFKSHVCRPKQCENEINCHEFFLFLRSTSIRKCPGACYAEALVDPSGFEPECTLPLQTLLFTVIGNFRISLLRKKSPNSSQGEYKTDLKGSPCRPDLPISWHLSTRLKIKPIRYRRHGQDGWRAGALKDRAAETAQSLTRGQALARRRRLRCPLPWTRQQQRLDCCRL